MEIYAQIKSGIITKTTEFSLFFCYFLNFFLFFIKQKILADEERKKIRKLFCLMIDEITKDIINVKT